VGPPGVAAGQRLQPDQPATELLVGKGPPEPFAAAEGDVDSSGQQQVQRSAEAAVEAADQLDVRYELAGGPQHPHRGVALGEQVDQQRARPVRAPQLLEGLVVEGEQLAGSDQQAPAFGGERDPAGGADEQPHAELPLQPADVAAEGLLGHVQAGGGAGKWSSSATATK
jgi:hypothetical protein